VIDLGALAERLHYVRQTIAESGGRDVAILAVTKGHPVDAIDAAATVGLHAVGENYAQELLSKLDGRSVDIAVHFIGQLQTNKVRHLAGCVDVFETLDRPSLAVELARRAPGAHVLVQVDATGEPGKGGSPPSDVEALVDQARQLGLAVDGLMTVGPTSGDREAARSCFRSVRHLCDRLGLATCSMGMTGDYLVAVQEGATQVRLGSALFGMRPRPAPRVR
jgi:PLP dependent protein